MNDFLQWIVCIGISVVPWFFLRLSDFLTIRVRITRLSHYFNIPIVTISFAKYS
jgi:purine-cytosine permease-like protein